MKKRLLTLMMVTLFTTSGFAVQAKAEGETSASTTETTYKESAGITPDSVLYSIDKLIDNVQVIISFSDERKIKVLMSNAEERLGESEVMAEEGNQEAAGEALIAYNDTVAKVNNVLDELVEANQDSEDTEKAEEIAKIEEAVAKQQESSTEVLEGMKDKVSGDSEDILERVLVMQIEKKAAVKEMVEARHELNAARKEYNAAKVQLKKVEKTGDEEAIKKAKEALTAAEGALDTEKGEYKTAFEAKQETVKKFAGAKSVVTEEDKETTEVITQKATDSTTSTDTSIVKVKEEKSTEEKKSQTEKSSTKKEDTTKNTSQVKEKSEKAAEVQNSGKRK